MAKAGVHMNPSEDELMMLEFIGLTEFPFADAPTDTPLYRFHQAAKGVTDNLKTFRQHVANVTRDPKLTVEGHRHSIRLAADQCRQRIDSLERYVEDARNQLPRLRDELRVRPLEGDAVVLAVRASEIRAWYRTIDRSEIEQAILIEVGNGGRELLEAYKRAPHGTLPPVAPELIRNAEEVLAERQNPEAAKRVRDLASAIESFDLLRKLALEEINQTAGIEPAPRTP